MPNMTKERVVRYDDKTGTKVVQLTSFPLPHYHQYCYGQWITRDARTLLFFGYRELARGAPVDLWRVDNDGDNLAPVANDAGWSVIAPDASTVYFARGGSIWRVGLHGDGLEEEVVREPEADSMDVSVVSPDGRYVFAQSHLKEGGFDVLRLDTRSGEAESVCRTPGVMHLQLYMQGGLLATIGPPDMPHGIYAFSFDGDDFRAVPFAESTNHFAALGGGEHVVTTLPSPGNAIDVAVPRHPGEPSDDDGEPAPEVYILADGVGFWHPTSDARGEWVVADTNWPDVGLQLIHAPSGRYRTLCQTGASGGHPQWAHAHPRLAPDGSYVVFDSDKSGICQVHAAHIDDRIKDELRSGDGTGNQEDPDA